ncbi:MAG: hypothetical protein HF314_16110 [Ignavibacteria bacterium]|jgi:hypothetical protein|nr:hypothetical protein [Ignavibacteria bacterium]MCU7504606.1 hypothetical protein [Ignavibacteria bacterium]MCU7517978.1 hypothetical protein [Ignavibacteria bacterium]
MQKLYSILCLLLFLAVPMLAQETKIILDEAFLDNRNNWPILDNDKIETQIEDGSYLLESSDENGQSVLKDVALDYSKNFSIETDFQLVDGKTNFGFGFLFGFKDWNNYYEFVVTANGFYRITHKYQGIFTGTGWLRNPNVSSQEYPNSLKIVKINDWIGFYLNNIFVNDSKDLEPAFLNMIRTDGFAGKKIGMVTWSDLKVKYTKLVLKELGASQTELYTYQTHMTPGEKRNVTLFSDDFSNNSNNWYLEKKEDNSFKEIKDGAYSFDNRSSSEIKATQNVFLSGEADYEIECSSKWIGGNDSCYYGLLWGYYDWSNYQKFVINSHGSARYENTASGNVNALTASFKPQAENLLRISKIKDSLYFYVNGSLLLKAPSSCPDGKETGFVVVNKQKVLFDNLKISQVLTYPKVLQESVVADESMKENKGTFSDKTETSHFKKLWKPGSLELTHDGDGGFVVGDEYYLDPREDFMIQAKTRWLSGDSTKSYGILWGEKDWDNCNEFVIGRDGSFKCTNTKDKVSISTGWKYAPALLNNPENTIAIKKCGSFLEYYINNQLVDILPFSTISGYTTGIIVYGKQTVGLENFTVKSFKVSKPDFEQSSIAFSEDYETNKPSLQGVSKSGNMILLTEAGKLHLAALFPELEAFTGSDVSSYTSGNMLVTRTSSSLKYPNKPFYQANSDVLPTFDERGRPSKAFSVEVTVGIMSNSHSRGAGIRIGGNDFLVNSDGEYIMDIKDPLPLDDNSKPSTNIYHLKVECAVNGLMYFYVNGKMAGYSIEALTDRSAGPIVYAFNSLSEAWFDDFIVRTY